MSSKTLDKWESLFLDYFSKSQGEHDDAAHDLSHFQRVNRMAQEIAQLESEPVDLLTLLAAAYFHDIVSLPKDHPDNNKSSTLAAIKAKEILQTMNFPGEKMEAVCHAIKTHSFSANIPPQTLEAKIIQDADRMESLGAIGIMRTFYVTGKMGREAYDPDDLYAKSRDLNDKLFGLDHFYVKLFKLPDLLKTRGGRQIAKKRSQFLSLFITELEKDIELKQEGATTIIKFCKQAGVENFKLFDPIDPLAKNRSLAPSNFAIDKLLSLEKSEPHFIRTFLNQLEIEVS
jgi:uncharacterized protein